MRIKIDDVFSVTVEQLIDNDRAWFVQQGHNAFNIPLKVDDFDYRFSHMNGETQLVFAVTGTVDEEELEAVLAERRPWRSRIC